MNIRRLSSLAATAFLALVLLGNGATAASSSSGPKLPQLDLAKKKSKEIKYNKESNKEKKTRRKRLKKRLRKKIKLEE